MLFLIKENSFNFSTRSDQNYLLNFNRMYSLFTNQQWTLEIVLLDPILFKYTDSKLVKTMYGIKHCLINNWKFQRRLLT